MIVLSQEPMTWVMSGDSITQATVYTHGARGWAEHVRERICGQMKRLHDVVINTGVSGWRAADVLAAYDRLIGRFAPDVLSVALGTNDALAGRDGLAEFERSMRGIVARAAGAQIVLHTPVLTTLRGRSIRAELPSYCRVVRDIAADTGATLVDHEAEWAAHFGELDPIAWLDDRVHPNAAGHRAMADHTLRALGLGELSDL